MKGLKNYVIIFSALLAVYLSYGNALPSVLRFDVESKQKGQLGTVQVTNCLPKDKELAVVSVTLEPEVLVFPGSFSVSFNITVKETVDSPVKTVMYLAKREGSTWIKIPCIGQIGSCTYDDLCQILSQISECPPPFEQAKVPCKCPFNKGEYVLPKSTFDVESALFPPGDYHGQANLTMNGQVVGCYDIMATFG